MALTTAALALAACATRSAPQAFAPQPADSGLAVAFVERDLRVEFRATPDRRFEWRFKNLHIVAVTIEHDDLYLRVAGDPTRYTLWGEDKAKAPSQPPIRLGPGQFIKLAYSVRYRSPLFPFDKIEDPVFLELQATWGKRTRPFSIAFPPPKPEPPPEHGVEKDG